MYAWRGLDPRTITSVARTLRAAAFPARKPASRGPAAAAADQPAAPATVPAPDAPEAATSTR